MRGISAVSLMIISVLAGCRYEPEEPRDAKIPRPKTVPAYVQVEPFQAGNEETQPLIMRAVLRCHQDAQGRARCELEVPRSRARMG
jgi:hypothetical protein